jgi:hypothetical protein
VFAGSFLSASFIAKPNPSGRPAVEALRRQRYTGKQIATEVGVSVATVSRICVGSG